MELGLLSDAQILLCVIEKTDKMTIYKSDEQTLSIMQDNLKNFNVPKEFLANDDVFIFFNIQYNEIFSEKSDNKKPKKFSQETIHEQRQNNFNMKQNDESEGSFKIPDSDQFLHSKSLNKLI